MKETADYKLLDRLYLSEKKAPAPAVKDAALPKPAAVSFDGGARK